MLNFQSICFSNVPLSAGKVLSLLFSLVCLTSAFMAASSFAVQAFAAYTLHYGTHN